mmetsp:Transcript_26392/g.78046  ORF Transcript_26392/g.78046 Transcript_26392/m.78046 type:complete len:214 (+) Transcript_26392:1038-1679(+)
MPARLEMVEVRHERLNKVPVCTIATSFVLAGVCLVQIGQPAPFTFSARLAIALPHSVDCPADAYPVSGCPLTLLEGGVPDLGHGLQHRAVKTDGLPYCRIVRPEALPPHEERAVALALTFRGGNTAVLGRGSVQRRVHDARPRPGITEGGYRLEPSPAKPVALGVSAVVLFAGWRLKRRRLSEQLDNGINVSRQLDCGIFAFATTAAGALFRC